MATTTTLKDTTPPVAPSVLANDSFTSLLAPQVTMATNAGRMTFELNTVKAPISAANMLAYVDSGFYTGTLFHRVIPDFVAQAGGYTTGLNYKTPLYAPIALESNNGLSNLRGTLGMARTDNPNSATSQFYVNLVDNRGLDYASANAPGYAVFGKVVAGMNVIDSIAARPTNTATNVPLTDIVILSAAENRISKTGVVSVGALETGAKWEYSTDAGTTWKKGKGSSFKLAEGSYTENTLQVRQTDAAGNRSIQTGKSQATLIVDKTAPKLVSSTPANGTKSANPTEDIVITFSEAVVLGTGLITLKTAKGTVVESYQVSPGSSSHTSLTINPSNDLAYGAGYVLEIGAGTISDLAGNAHTGSKNYKFTTTDTVKTAAASHTLGTEANKLSYTGTGDFSGRGNDAGNVLTGGDGNDSLWGKGGNDVLIGGDGADILYGEEGSDTLTGGAGGDYFVLSDPAHTGVDLFVDFQPGEDKIAFLGAKFIGLPTTLTAANLLISSAKKPALSGQHLIYNPKSGLLSYDADGDAATPAVKLALIGKTTHPTLAIEDFFVG